MRIINNPFSWMVVVIAFFLFFCYANWMDITINKELDVVRILSVFINAIVLIYIASQITNKRESLRFSKEMLIKRVENFTVSINKLHNLVKHGQGKTIAPFNEVVYQLRKLSNEIYEIEEATKIFKIKIKLDDLKGSLVFFKKILTNVSTINMNSERFLFYSVGEESKINSTKSKTLNSAYCIIRDINNF